MSDTDFATYGDMAGLTKLEVLIALEEFINRKGLRKEALAEIDSYAAGNTGLVCELCQTPLEAGHILEDHEGYLYCDNPPCIE